MKLQALIFKVEELKSLISLYEQTQQNLAQATVVQETLRGEAEGEQQETVEKTVQQLTQRMGTIADMLQRRTSARDIDEAIERVQEHVARLQQFQQVRTEQLQLRMQLDLELELGPVAPETRQQAETALSGMQVRLETLVRKGESALGMPRLVTIE